MKISTSINKIISILFILFLWHILSKIYPPIIIPRFNQIGNAIKFILTDRNLINEMFRTISRLLLGLSFGIIAAIFLTVLVKYSIFLKDIIFPIVDFLQVIPPISWLILAILWLGLNGKPAILIVSISVFCIMFVSLINAIKNIDNKLLEVGKIFNLSKFSIWKYIILPSLYPAFETALIISLGTAVKLIVMAEVLTTNSGIGGEITNARLNLETEIVIAWTIIIVLIYYFLGGLIKCLRKSKILRKFWYQNLSAKSMKKI